MTIRLVLAEDNALLREGMRGLLADEPDIELVAACSDLPSLLAAIDESQPDVVLTDIRMPPSRTDEGLRAAEHCRRTQPRTGVVLLSQYADPAYLRPLLAAGTEGRGYLLKERVGEVDELIEALRTVAAGGSVVDPKVVEMLVRMKSATATGDLAALTPREREVLGEMARGRTNAAIAASLFVTQKAVEKHINSIFMKLGMGEEDGVHPRVRAVLLYLAQGVTT